MDFSFYIFWPSLAHLFLNFFACFLKKMILAHFFWAFGPLLKIKLGQILRFFGAKMAKNGTF